MPIALTFTPGIADVAVSITDLAKSGRLSLIECIREDDCFAATRDIRRGYSTIVLYPGDPMHPAPPTPLPAPAPASHTLIGSHWIFQANEPTTGSVRATLRYDDAGLDAQTELSLDLLYLEQAANGPV